MTTASTYEIPAAATPGANENGMQKAASCSVIGRGAAGDLAPCNGVGISGVVGGGTRAWVFTRVPPS
jgi:hypothetical protein